MTWPLGGRTDDLEERCIRANTLFLEPSWTGDRLGDGGWTRCPRARAARAGRRGRRKRAHRGFDDARDRRRRTSLGALWEWVASKIAQEPLWHLDSVAVEPGWQGHGIGSALVEFALEQMRQSGVALVRDGHAAQRSALRAPRIRGRRGGGLARGRPSRLVYAPQPLTWREPATRELDRRRLDVRVLADGSESKRAPKSLLPD